MTIAEPRGGCFEHLAVLRTLSVKLGSAIDLHDVLGILARTAVEHMGTQGAAVISWDTDGTRTYCLGRDGSPGGEAASTPYEALRHHLDAHACEEGGAAVMDKLPYAARAELAALGVAIVVPLAAREQVIGALALGPRLAERPYTPLDLALLEAIAAQAATAIESAQRLQAADLRLAQNQKHASLGMSIACVAHEINNPVTCIVDTAGVLRDLVDRLHAIAARHPEAPLDPVLADLREGVDLVARGADRTAAIVRDLSTFSRAGGDPATTLDVHDALEISLRLLRSRIGKNVAIHRNYGTLPTVESLGDKLSQVFMNVLANACDAVGERGNISVTTHTDGERVTVLVRDDGPGIAPTDLARVLEPFFTTKPYGKGTGLGLAIAREIVAEHGGTIEVQSAPGTGTTVVITVPRWR